MAQPGEDHGFTFLSHVPGLGHDAPVHVVGAVVVGLALVATTFFAKRQLERAMKGPDGGVIPPSRWSYLNFFEIVAEQIYKLTESVLGKHDAPRYFPLIGCLFTFIFTCNIMGLLPGFLPPTDNLNTTLALGSIVFVYYNYLGIKANGWGYLKHFLGPSLALAPLLLVIELISHFVRPVSLGLRLRGNMYGDHLVLSVFNELTPLLIPVIFLGLGLFVSFIQAFVFCLLTMVYIQLATAHDH